MFELAAADFLAIWESGQKQRPFEKGLAILSRGCPCLTRDDLALLPIVQRDALLLHLREQTFGSELKAFAVCPRCREQLEFILNTTELWRHIPDGYKSGSAAKETIVGEFRLRIRLPNSADMAAVVESSDGEDSLKQMRITLLRRCVMDATRNNTPVSIAELPDDTIVQVESHISEIESQAEFLIDIECAACHHVWLTVFDIASFLYSEISFRAKRLLDDIHTLAFAYGWNEKEILAMSTTRRQFYVDRVG